MSISEQCIALLMDNLRYAPEFGDRLSNHLSMALVALEKMGAPPSRLEAFTSTYIKRLTPFSETRTPTAAVSPQEHLGDANRFSEHLRFFTDAIGVDGTEETLGRWIPLLVPGLSGAGFHGIIRTAYAVESELESEIAFALAYWAGAYQSLGDISDATDEDCWGVAKALIDTGRFPRLTEGIIADRILTVGRCGEFRNARTQPTELSLGKVAEVSIEAFRGKSDFTLLHAVTACHAFRRLRSYLPPDDEGLRYLWQAVLAALLSTGMDTPPGARASLPSQSLEPWHRCIEYAAASDDAHVIKLVYTAWQESAIYDERPYLEIANRAAC
jgi:hypothetical protein